MKIFKTIYATFNNREFYKEIPTHSLKKVLGFYAKLSLLIALISFILCFIFITPIAVKFQRVFEKDLTSAYPKGFEVGIKAGIANTNVSSEPYFIPVTPNTEKYLEIGFRRNQRENLAIKNILVIDTKSETEPTIESFRGFQTLGFLSKKYFIYEKGNGAVMFSPLEKFPDSSIKEQDIKDFVKVSSVIPYILPILCFVFVFFASIISLIPLLLVALIFMLLQKFLKREFSFENSYKICVYASTLPLIFSSIFFFSGFHLRFIFALLTLIVALINTKHYPETETLPGINS